MSVTLWPTGLTITDGQAARLDTFCVEVWLPRYRDAHDGADPPGWPSQLAHRTLAEWTVVELMTGLVLHWERRQAEEAIEVPPWEA